MDNSLKCSNKKYLIISTVLHKEFNKEEFENYARNAEKTYGIHLPKDKNVWILDAGCGQGHFLYYLIKKGYCNICGVDIASDQVEFCRKHITENVECADFTKWIPGKSFDVIVMNEILEHIPKPNVISTIKLAYEGLSDKGIFIVKVPNMRNPFNLAARYIDFTHEVGFTENSLYQVLRMAGFDASIYPDGYERKKHIWLHPKVLAKWLVRRIVLIVLRYCFGIANVHPVSGRPLNLFSMRIVAVARKSIEAE